jgi:hypothetical protein
MSESPSKVYEDEGQVNISTAISTSLMSGPPIGIGGGIKLAGHGSGNKAGGLLARRAQGGQGGKLKSFAMKLNSTNSEESRLEKIRDNSQRIHNIFEEQKLNSFDSKYDLGKELG